MGRAGGRMLQQTFSSGVCPQRNLSKNYFHVIVNSMSWSISAGFSTLCSGSLIKTVLGYLAASIRGPCIYNCINRLTLCLISWRTQHATHSAAGSSPTSACLQTITERGRCSRSAPSSWPTAVTPAQKDVRPESTSPKLDHMQAQHQPFSQRRSSNGACQRVAFFI